MSTVSPEISPESENPSAPVAAMAVGALVGALIGVGAAYFLARQDARRPAISSKQLLKAGVLLFTTAKQIAALVDEED